ncbi:MAG: LysM peptidoglycan-binding domain-containing protein [Rhodocyclales bacterium]|nr:LysM peptidoglycan-binding domain-containing protein [Rhodocyclales bacterium]
MIRIIFPLIFAVATLFSGAVAAQSIEVADDAPDSYTVVRGDTLWDISARFLKQPWRWPEVWRLNREQISNPHLIYPGQVIMLDRSGPWLTIGKRIGGDQRLSPQIYTEEVDRAIATIPMRDIEPFLIRPLFSDDSELFEAGTVVATEVGRVIMGVGDAIFAKDVAPEHEIWQIFRPSEPLLDPVTQEVLGYEASHRGSARLTEAGDPATLKILTAVEEITAGDRLLPSERPRLFAYIPHAPDIRIDGRVAGIYRGVLETGRHHVVAINIGERDGIEDGHVLALFRSRGQAEYKDEKTDTREVFELPEQRYGLALVFRVFDRVAYALVMDTDGPVKIGDSLRTP